MHGQHAAGVFHVAQQAEHQAVAVDDAGGRRQQRGLAGQVRLQRQRLGLREQLQITHAVGGCALADGTQLVHLRRAGGDYQLAAAPVRDAAFGAVAVQKLFPLHAQPRLEGTLRVVDARVDHLAVARAGGGAEAFRRLQHQHLAPGQRQRARHCQADHAGADDHGIDLLRAHRTTVRAARRRRQSPPDSRAALMPAPRNRRSPARRSRPAPPPRSHPPG